MGGTVKRTAITFVICLFALLVPLSSFGSPAPFLGHPKAVTHGEPKAPHPDFSSVPDEDQPEESGKTFSAAPTEEETKAKPDLIDLTSLLNRAHPTTQRVDHAYEAWFYSVTHPPLTPPPNAL